MGQAKQRGSLQERIASAQQQKLDGERITIEEAKRRLELPDNAEFLGYVIHLYDQDEFVGKIEENDVAINRVYVKIPDLAHVFDSVEEAIDEALKIDKYRLLVCLLFEVDNQHMIHDVWANFED
ncbi:hypothetical protein Q8G42_04985 [Acinetobacter lwoffii]|uniref:Uncharacterized protein n=2 Tax=Acinetobacter TaxID=469 RepID=A0AAW8B0F8_ACILW|nr:MULTISPECIES: hypothetical protein [Pseudomonadota]MDP1371919.1 hypothetical protein [Acinetobacter lwoffii]MDP1389551.1 hypothetical protein [Acinetobacter lwoffii]MDP1449010.1 hypothetical protein [Acinetobacter lwoffii]SPJ20597.1 hypothetical protein PFCIP103579_1741 [Prolinoborus fasciculus]